MSYARTKSRTTKKSATPEPPLEPLAPLQPGLLYTQREVARHLRLKNYRTLSVWRCLGRNPELKAVTATLGTSNILYRGEDVIAFVAGRKSKSRSKKKE
jgi:hypothetical protein